MEKKKGKEKEDCWVGRLKIDKQKTMVLGQQDPPRIQRGVRAQTQTSFLTQHIFEFGVSHRGGTFIRLSQNAFA